MLFVADLKSRQTGLPDWLWTSLPNLRDLDLSDNPLVYLPPVVIAFEHLERLYTDQPDRLPKSNMEELVNEARMRRIQQTRPCVPSLTMLCTQVLRKSEYNPEEYTIPHLRRYWDIPWYVCASCKEIILLGDAYYLPVPLRERFTRFEPCVTELSPNGQLPPGTHKRTFMVSSPTWTFCASCLILHTQDSSIESSEQCRCTLCSASRRLWSKKKAIRWAKQHVASLKMDAVLQIAIMFESSFMFEIQLNQIRSTTLAMKFYHSTLLRKATLPIFSQMPSTRFCFSLRSTLIVLQQLDLLIPSYPP